jgi:hypothetical protein
MHLVGNTMNCRIFVKGLAPFGGPLPMAEGLIIPWSKGCEGSSPSVRTSKIKDLVRKV